MRTVAARQDLGLVKQEAQGRGRAGVSRAERATAAKYQPQAEEVREVGVDPRDGL